MSSNRRYYAVLFLLLLLSVVVGREMYARLILPAAPLNFDEAAHSLPSFYILRDIKNLDAKAFWGDTHIQTLWPPGFSYLQAPFLAVLGRTDESARLFSYTMLVLALFVGCAVTHKISPKLAPVAALVSGLLALSAPGWLFTSSWAMQETPVALVVFVAFWLYLHAAETQQPKHFAYTSVALFFVFLTKYNYAAFALVAIGFVDLLLRAQNVRSQTTNRARISAFGFRSFAGLYIPFVLGLLLWFFGGTDVVPTDIKWRDFRFFVTNENSGYAFWSADNLLFYVRVAEDWLMPHPIILILCLAWAGYAVRWVKHQGVWMLAIFFGLGFVLATAHPLKAQRYITPLFPALWVLAGVGAAQWARQQKWGVLHRHASAVTAILALLVAIGSWGYWLPRLQPVWAGDSATGTRQAAQQIVAWQNGNQPVLIIGTFGELSPPLFEWRLRPIPVFAAHGNIQYDAPPGEGDDLARVQNWADQNPNTQITTIEIAESSPLFNTQDMQQKNLWRQTLANQFNANHATLGFRLVETKILPAGITLRFYVDGD